MEREQLIRQPGDDDYSWMHGHELQPFILLMLLLVCIKYVVALIMIQMGQVKLTGFHVLFLIGDASNVHLEFLFLLLSFSTFYGLCCLDQLDFLDDAVFSGRHSRSNVHLEHLLFLFVICCLYVAALMVKRGQMNPGRFPVYLAIADASNVHLEYPVTLLLYCVKYVVCLMIRREQLEPGVYVYSRVPGGDKIHLEFLLMVFLCCMKYVIPFIIKSQWEQPKQPGDHVYSRMLGVISAHYPLLLIALLIRCVKHGFSKTIQKEQLKPGDHIYSWRRGGLISHHGLLLILFLLLLLLLRCIKHGFSLGFFFLQWHILHLPAALILTQKKSLLLTVTFNAFNLNFLFWINFIHVHEIWKKIK